MRTTLGAMLALLLTATAIHAQVAPANPKRAARLAALVEWTKKVGIATTLDGRVAQPLGLGHGKDIPVRRRAFRDISTNVIYGINLVSEDSREVYVVFRIIPGQTVLWKMDQRGAIEAVVVSTKVATGRSNDPHLSKLEETMSFLACEKNGADWDGKSNSCQAGSNAHNLSPLPVPAPGPNGGSATAVNPQDFSKCIETNTGNEGLSACTRSIESGHYQGHALALLYLSRAFKYDHTEHDYASAVADYEQSLALNPQEDAAVKNFFLPEAKRKAATSNK